MSEEKEDSFIYKILTPEAKISVLYQTLQELETELYSMSMEEPIVEDPNHPEWNDSNGNSRYTSIDWGAVHGGFIQLDVMGTPCQ